MPTTPHTPGPWTTCSGMVETVVPDKNGEHVCGIPIAYMDREPGNGTKPVERDANARLIAAAPGMLALLRQVAGLYSPDDDNHGDPSKGLSKEARALLAGLG